jgi:hypothetical protein
MFEFLCKCALDDPFERKDDREDNPRQLALEIIIKQYRDYPQTLPLLQDRAKNDSDEKVREFVQKKLAELESKINKAGINSWLHLSRKPKFTTKSLTS